MGALWLLAAGTGGKFHKSTVRTGPLTRSRIRLFSAASFKSLGTLSYHRESVAALAFANPQHAAGLLPAPSAPPSDTIELERGAEGESASDDSDEEDTSLVPRERWLASGGKDRRIALWGLMDFGRGSAAP